MKGTIQKWKIMILLSVLLFVSNMAFAEDETKNNTEGNPVDTALVTSPLSRRIFSITSL